MKAKTLKALNDSIAHWTRFASGTSKPKEEPYTADCALCKVFYRQSGNCDGCPVMEKTGLRMCIGSPYIRAESAFSIHGKDSKQFKTAAKAELAFLKGLLPKQKRK